MTSTAIAPAQSAPAIEKVLIEGDLSRLSADQKVAYYMKVCESLGLNPYTKPFDYLKLNGREILYARKDATDQLRKAQHVSIVGLQRERLDDLYVVTATARTPDGRSDSSIGAVMVKGLMGEGLANALMKAETKAKRRVTLSICGLGMTDDTEVDSIPGAQRTNFNGPVYSPEELGEQVDDEGRVVEVQEAPKATPLRERDVEDRAAIQRAGKIAQEALEERFGGPEPAPPPKARKAPPSREVLADRYAKLVETATEYGIPLDPEQWGIGEDTTAEEIAKKGAELKHMIYGDSPQQAA